MSKLDWQLAKLEAKLKKGDIIDDVYRVVKRRLEEQAEKETYQRPSTIWEQEQELAEAIEKAERGGSLPLAGIEDAPTLDPLAGLIAMRANGEITAEEFASARARLASNVQPQRETQNRTINQFGSGVEAASLDDLGPARPAKSVIGKGWLITILIVGVIVLFVTFNPRDPCSDKNMAFVMSKHFAKERLKSPATAEFASMTDDGVIVVPQGACRFTVKSYVDAQNGFGAQIRTRFIAQVSGDKSSGEWELISFRFEED
jgi:hypothetical protein